MIKWKKNAKNVYTLVKKTKQASQDADSTN